MPHPLNLSNLIGLLVLAAKRLTYGGQAKQARQVERTVGGLLDLEDGKPNFIIDPIVNGPIASVVESEITATSRAVRTAEATTPTSASEWRRIRRQLKMHPPRRKKWTCCLHPEKRRTRKGKMIWGAVCQYVLRGGKSHGERMAMWITLSKDPSTRPRQVNLNGKRIKFCTNAQLPASRKQEPVTKRRSVTT